MTTSDQKNSYKNAVAYRIYPKSFFDSDGDGIGDLAGITAKLPYLIALGADILVISSLFETDFEFVPYGTTDYRRINPVLGGMDDFEGLLAAAHASGIKIYLSISLSSTSAAHDWFNKSRTPSELNPYREYYIRQKGKDKIGKTPPDSEKNLFGAPAWVYDKRSGDWYKNLYGKDFPLLNFENPRVRRDILEIFRFWIEKGVDGFFVENARFSSKRVLISDPKPIYTVKEDFFDEGRLLYRILSEIKGKIAPSFPLVLNAESTDPAVYPYLIAGEEPIGNSLCAEGLIAPSRLPGKGGFSLKKFLTEYLTLMRAGYDGKISLAFGDPCHRRLLSAMNPGKEYEIAAAKFLAALLLTANATPIVYQGEEIGMTDFLFKKSTENAMEKDYLSAGSPMQWDNIANAGFGTESYLPVNDNYRKVNIAAESADPDSVLTFYRRLIAFRKASSALSDGNFEDHSQGDSLLFIRSTDTESLLIIANASKKRGNFKLPLALMGKDAYCELCNYTLVSQKLHPTMGLRPYEVRIYRLPSRLLALS